MRRSRIGFFLLLVLLAAGLFSTKKMISVHEPIEVYLSQAAYWAVLDDWETADLFFQKAKRDWKRSEHFRSCFADHNPVEDIDAALGLLEVYGNARERICFAGGCRDLARRVAALGEAHELVWWNLL